MKSNNTSEKAFNFLFGAIPVLSLFLVLGCASSPKTADKTELKKDPEVKAYTDIFYKRVNNNLVVLAGKTAKNLFVETSFLVSATGEMRELHVEKSSNDPEFDQAALKAVSSANPLPKPPSVLVGQKIFIRLSSGF